MSEKPQVEQDASRDQPCGAPKSAAPEAQPSGGFTPGPWSAFGEAVDWPGIEGPAGSGVSIVIYGEPDEERDYGVRGKTHEEAHANARLIASAPDLLRHGWTLAVLALQSNRYRDEPDFRDAVDAMLDTCRVARGEPTLAEHQAAKASAR